MDMTSDFYIDRLITSTVGATISNFRTSAYYSATFDISGQLCLAFGWKSDAVSLDLTYQYETQDCEKVMIDDMSDWLLTVRGEDKKYIDSCSLSAGGGPIKMKSLALSSDAFEHDILGGSSADEAGCIVFAEFSDWAPYAAKYTFDAVNYMF